MLCLATPPLAAAPLAEWAGGRGLETQAAVRFADMKRARCLPDVADSAVPAYPKSRVIALAWGRQPPDCRLRKGWSQLGAIRLGATDDVERVVDWYAERLREHARFDAPDGVIFLRGQPSDFTFERDYHKYPNVYVRKAEPAWRGAGFATVVELNRPAP